MLKYKIDVLEALKNAGYNTTVLRQQRIIGEGTIQQFRQGDVCSAKTLDTLCRLLQLQPADIIEWIPDN